MTQKIILISLFILFAGALIAGGIYRTSAKSGYDISLGGENGVEITQNADSHTPRALGAQEGQQSGERQGQQELGRQGLGNQSQGQGRNRKTEEAVPGEEGTYGQGRGGQGKEYDGNGGEGQGRQGEGYGQAQSELGRQGQQGQGQGQNQQENYADAQDMIIIEGTISQAPAAGVDMILETESGQVLIGTGPGWLQEQGFDLANGDAIQVSGYYENDEFKAVTITRLADGLNIALRDEYGRPMWSGAGRRAQGGQGQGQSYQQQNQNSTGI